MSSDYIRPFSVLWYRNMHKQGKSLTADSVTGFPELVASSGLEDYVDGSGYPKGVLVYKGGFLFRSNTIIPAGTAFVEGSGPQQWTNVTEAVTSIPDFDPNMTYYKNEPVFYNSIIYRAKVDGITGAWARNQWERISQPPMRVFFSSTDPESVVTEGFKTQEIIFESDRTIGNYRFFDGDRILLRKDLTGGLSENDFYYFPFASADKPDVVVPEANDEIYVGSIHPDASINIFYVFDPTIDYIDVGANDVDKITWDVNTDPTAGYVIKSIKWFREDENDEVVLVKDTDFTIDPADRTRFMFQTSNIGPERGDRLTVTFGAP